ncbi:MAG: response regulator [Chitinophagaceae bacterium]
MVIRTLWLCKNNLFATSISSLLRNYGISTVAITDPEKVYPYFQAIEADLIIIDANWDKDDHWGIAFLAGLHQRIPHIKAILVTTTLQNRLCKKLEEAGAKGYFYRNSRNIENIVHCIRQVYRGEVCFGETDPALTEATIQAFPHIE